MTNYFVFYNRSVGTHKIYGYLLIEAENMRGVLPILKNKWSDAKIFKCKKLNNVDGPIKWGYEEYML